MCSRAQEHPGFNKQSSSHQTVHLKIVLADLFQLMTIPVSLEQPGMMTKETTLAPPMSSHAQEQPGLNKQNSSPQTVQQETPLVFLFHLLVTLVLSEQPGMMTKETTLAQRMSSHAQEQPGPNKQNSSPQTVQQKIILACLFPSQQTPLSSEHHRQETMA